MRKFLSMSLVLLVANSCGKKENDDATESFESQIVGEWETGCVETKSGGSRYYWKFLSDGKFKTNEIRYKSKTCLDESQEFYLDGAGSYTIGAASTTQDSSRNITFVFTSFSGKSLNEEFTDSLNSDSYCGMTNWSANQVVNLFGKTCTNSSDQKEVYPTNNLEYKDLVDVANSSLWLGVKANAFTDPKLPGKLDTVKAYKRKM